MAINDIFQVTLKQSWLPTGEFMYHNLWYSQVNIDGTAEDLANAILETGGLAELLNGMQGSKCVNETIKVINLFSFTDFFEDDWDGAGAYTASQMLPIHSAINFTKKTDNRSINNGTFRFSGIPEEEVADGVVTGSGYIALLNAFRAKMAVDAVDAALEVFDPVVVKRILDPDPTPLGSTPIYRLPANFSEADWAHIITVLVNTRVSHQVSRGNGR